jgi:hypothetical protein
LRGAQLLERGREVLRVCGTEANLNVVVVSGVRTCMCTDVANFAVLLHWIKCAIWPVLTVSLGCTEFAVIISGDAFEAAKAVAKALVLRLVATLVGAITGLNSACANELALWCRIAAGRW